MLEKIRHMTVRRRWQAHGFTVTELLVVIGIVAILSALAIPSYNRAVDKYRLKGAAKMLRGDLKCARSQAITANQFVYIDIVPGPSWCYGMKLGGICRCAVANSCTLKQVDADDFSGVTLTTSTFAADPAFDPVRGVVSTSGYVLFESAQERQALVNLNLVGKIGVCTPAGTSSAGYPSC